MRAFLDTGVLIAGVSALPAGVTEIAVCSISYAELEFGVAASKDPVQRVLRQDRLNDLRATFGEGASFDDAAAVSYGLITALVLASGRSPRGRIADLLIASVAHASDAALVTTNPDDFAGLESLVTIVPVEST